MRQTQQIWSHTLLVRLRWHIYAKKIKVGQECWERQSPWATSAIAHLSDGLAKTGNMTLCTYYLCLFPQPGKISCPALINQHFLLSVSLTSAQWSPLPSSAVSSLLPLLWVTVVFELPFPLVHFITVSFDLLLALCERNNLSSQPDGNLRKSSTAFQLTLASLWPLGEPC